MENYTLTVAIPTYNRKTELEIALKSVVRQYDSKVELIVSDNNSEDGTEELMKDYVQKYPFIKYVRNDKNIGGSYNFMSCFKMAKGKYVLLLCDDDVLCAGALSRIVDFISHHNDINLCYLNHVFFRDTYISEKECTEPYLKITKDLIIEDKNVFIKFAGMRITYTSSLIFNRDMVLNVPNPEQYFETRFLSACLAMITTSGNSKIGIISFPCIAANLPSNVTNYNGFKLFGINVKNVLCGIGTKSGYDPLVLETIYKEYVLSAYVKAIANAKINKQENLWKEFKKYVWPAVKMYPIKREILLISMIIPGFIWKPIRNNYSKRKYGRK